MELEKKYLLLMEIDKIRRMQSAIRNYKIEIPKELKYEHQNEHQKNAFSSLQTVYRIAQEKVRDDIVQYLEDHINRLYKL